MYQNHNSNDSIGFSYYTNLANILITEKLFVRILNLVIDTLALKKKKLSTN